MGLEPPEVWVALAAGEGSGAPAPAGTAERDWGCDRPLPFLLLEEPHSRLMLTARG